MECCRVACVCVEDASSRHRGEGALTLEGGLAECGSLSSEATHAGQPMCPAPTFLSLRPKSGAHLQSERLKNEGNELFGCGELASASAKYSAALEAAPSSAARQRAVCLGNRAACALRLGDAAGAVEDCTAALEADPAYAKVLLRRAAAHEALDDLESALQDAEAALALEAGNDGAQRMVRRLTPLVAERREKLKEEMLGKLKDLGNTVLGKFGMSLDNFKAEKDPKTGGYSIKFGQ